MTRRKRAEAPESAPVDDGVAVFERNVTQKQAEELARVLSKGLPGGSEVVRDWMNELQALFPA